jgi:hypothetical protein
MPGAHFKLDFFTFVLGAFVLSSLGFPVFVCGLAGRLRRPHCCGRGVHPLVRGPLPAHAPPPGPAPGPLRLPLRVRPMRKWPRWAAASNAPGAPSRVGLGRGGDRRRLFRRRGPRHHPPGRCRPSPGRGGCSGERRPPGPWRAVKRRHRSPGPWRAVKRRHGLVASRFLAGVQPCCGPQRALSAAAALAAAALALAAAAFTGGTAVGLVGLGRVGAVRRGRGARAPAGARVRRERAVRNG